MPCNCKFSELTNDPFHRRTKAKQAGGKEEEVADTGRPNSKLVIHFFGVFYLTIILVHIVSYSIIVDDVVSYPDSLNDCKDIS